MNHTQHTEIPPVGVHFFPNMQLCFLNTASDQWWRVSMKTINDGWCYSFQGCRPAFALGRRQTLQHSLLWLWGLSGPDPLRWKSWAQKQTAFSRPRWLEEICLWRRNLHNQRTRDPGDEGQGEGQGEGPDPLLCAAPPTLIETIRSLSRGRGSRPRNASRIHPFTCAESVCGYLMFIT